MAMQSALIPIHSIDGWRLKKCPGVCVRGKQRFDFAAKIGVAGAGLSQIPKLRLIL
jgi:hypothetical protein